MLSQFLWNVWVVYVVIYNHSFISEITGDLVIGWEFLDPIDWLNQQHYCAFPKPGQYSETCLNQKLCGTSFYVRNSQKLGLYSLN